MKQPQFWLRSGSFLGRALSPLGWVYAGTTAYRLAHTTRLKCAAPVICVGNLTAGGAGKTPIVRDIAERLTRRGKRPAIVTRGYGGRLKGPVQVDVAHHFASDVGDEPLMLAGDFPCWIGRDRARTAVMAVAGGANIVVLDDGFQNPSVLQDLKLIVVDGETGFGNGYPIPAGPLREFVSAGMSRADALIVMGDDRSRLEAESGGRIPVLQAKLQLRDPMQLESQRVVAFAGIGRPEKFRQSLQAAGAEIIEFVAFPDHHAFQDKSLTALASQATAARAALVTTEKDWVRLTPAWRLQVICIQAMLEWRDETQIDALLDRVSRDV